MTIQTKMSSQDTSVQQFTSQIPTISTTQFKLKLHRHVIIIGSSRRVQDGVDEVISYPTAML
jgi:hypothetical protein